MLDNEPIDAVPFVSLTPIVMPHRFFGLSVADLVKDLQLVKSTILRQILDAMPSPAQSTRSSSLVA